jgi:pimeloyl-ACP methyl ester carboxylesterase
MNAFRTRIPPLSRPGALLFVALAVASFHVAYQPASFGPLRLLIILYPISLVQLARLRTTRGSFYAGLQRGSEELQVRVHGLETSPTLIYLPGLHGDWTLIGGLRKAVANTLRFVEITYPRTLDWSLDDYAAGVEKALLEKGITGGWLLAESFSSQVAWSLVARGTFRAEGVILAGGFVRHPARAAVRLAERICGRIPLSLLVRVMFGYATIARFRYRRSPETLAGIHEFIERRTELDRQAATHRLRLVAQNDPRAIVRQTAVPVYALSGWLDPIVPWFCVRRWLRRHCPALRDYQIVRSADHNVLGTAPDAAAKHILRWIAGSTRPVAL